ncbi:hypothetical protein AB6A40_009830 [Gnathostoma spinigerum]|uniref:Uncharacterized protein n=1 Tax=Gnathostoma spinigerum TaxID=75299 RepID=A0ABD6ETE3_9BILA
MGILLPNRSEVIFCLHISLTYRMIAYRFRLGFRYVFRWLPCVSWTVEEYEKSMLFPERVRYLTTQSRILTYSMRGNFYPCSSECSSSHTECMATPYFPTRGRRSLHPLLRERSTSSSGHVTNCVRHSGDTGPSIRNGYYAVKLSNRSEMLTLKRHSTSISLPQEAAGDSPYLDFFLIDLRFSLFHHYQNVRTSKSALREALFLVGASQKFL